MSPASRVNSIAIIIILSLVTTAGAADKPAGDEPQRLDWLEGFTLVELETDDVASLHGARNLIEAHGGQIAILSPPSLMMGWVPFESRDELVGRANIKAIYFTDVVPGEVEIKDPQTRHMVTYFNRVIRGEYEEEFRRGRLAAPVVDPLELVPDAKDRGELEQREYLDNLTANGFDIGELRDRGILLDRSTFATAGNSDYMSGTVTTTLIFVESDGSGADPNSYTWTDQHVQDYIAGVNTGMAWWSSRSRNYNDCWVAFFVRYVPPTDSRCQQWREMVLHPQGDVAGMVFDVMGNFGYTSGNHITRVNSYNTARRAAFGTDWAYTGFVAYNPPPAPDRLTDGASAFAYLGGPYTFLLYRSYGWAPEQVFAHESGHIFRACDEYASGCSSTSCTTTCANGVVNGNCEDCTSPVPCMMLANSFALCSYTDDHVGWQVSPCAPAPLTPPTVNAALPATGTQGLSLDVTIAGSDFLYGAFADMGAGITINGTTRIGTDSLRVSITIANDATPGPRGVTVSNRDMQSGTLAGGFQVLTSTRHYVSLSGGSVFPYVTPADAATSIANAVGAADEGDSILVESTTIATASLIVDKGVTLSGAWTGGFSGRDVVGARTVLTLNGNLIIGGGGGEKVVEGFILENGHGSADIVPTTGDFGGALKISGATATIANCEIRQNEATDGTGYGGGGGIFAYGSTVTIEYCDIHDNNATVGGGVYLYDCAATLTGNTIANNTVAANVGQPAAAGIALEACTGVSLVGNSIDGNTGAADGGGLWIANSTGVSVTSGQVTYNTASFSGAGAHLSKSEVDMTGVTFSRNTSAILGGGVAAADTSDVSLIGCSFLWNSGLIGAGTYLFVGNFTVRHTLLVGNAASSTGGGLYLSGAAAGEIVGNTLDRNTAGSGVGGVLVGNSPIEVYNNVIANSTGHGIACSGALPTLMYNDVWNSSGDDHNGCAPGTGSISLDPVFADTSATDYRLGVHSAAIDAGRPGAAYDDPDGSRGDMGRYGSHSFVMDQPTYAKNLTVDTGTGDVLLGWDSNPEGDIASYAVYCDTAGGFKPSPGNFVQFVTSPDTSVDLGAPGDTVYYKVGAIDADGYAGGYSNEGAASPATSVVDAVAYANRLHQNVPNPFNPTTTIRYELGTHAAVTLNVYDVGGRLVRRLVAATLSAGHHRAVWNGSNDNGARVSSGIYFYKLTTPSFTQTRKMILLK